MGKPTGFMEFPRRKTPWRDVNERLLDYYESQESDAKNVVILKPANKELAYYAVYGWTPASGVNSTEVPNPNTIWNLASPNTTLSLNQPIKLQWNNNNGLIFQREISIDQDFMFSIKQSVLKRFTLYFY